MYDRTGNYLIFAILLGMILGVVAVAIFGPAILPVKFLGDIFLNALKMIVIPLLFCSMVVGITRLGDIRKLGRTGLKTLSYFFATSSAAVVIGLILVNIFAPGKGLDPATFGVADTTVISYSFLDWLVTQIPSNIILAAAETKVLPIIIFAILFGGVLTTIGAKGKPVIAFFEGLNEAIMKIVHLIMWFAPIGIFGLVAGQLAGQGGIGQFWSIFSAVGKYSLVVIVGLLLHGVVVLPLILKFMAGKNPIEYFVGMSQALMTAFATASSSATLPVTMDCVEEKNDIDKRASSFVLPLGATINMDGTALYEAIAAIFIAQAYNISLPLWSQVTIFITAILASVGAAGIPQAGLVTMVLVLNAVGLPLDGIAMILAVDWFLDRCRTTVNVWGDSIGAAVIAVTSDIGLVDRRKRKPVSRTWSSRSKTATYRPDSRDNKRGRDLSRKKTSRERPTSKSHGTTERSAHRPIADKQKDSRRSRRPDRKSPREKELFPMSDRREIFKPDDEVVSPSHGSAKTAETAEAADKMREKKPTGRHRDKPARSRQTTPRKSMRDRSASKGSPKVAPEESFVAESGNEGSEFIVPKFPERILDELESYGSESGREKLQHLDDSEDKTADQSLGDDSPPPEAVVEKPATPDSDNIETETPSPEKDFNLLDKMVLGDAEDTGSEDKPPVEEVKDPDLETPPPRRGTSTLIPRAISDESGTSVGSIEAPPADETPTDKADKSVEPPMEKSKTEPPESEPASLDKAAETEEDSMDKPEIEASISESTSSDETAEVKADAKSEEEPASSDEAAEVKADAESEEKPPPEEPVKWGRSKRKRIKR